MNFRKFGIEEKQANAFKSAKIKPGEWIPDSITEKPSVRAQVTLPTFQNLTGILGSGI